MVILPAGVHCFVLQLCLFVSHLSVFMLSPRDNVGRGIVFRQHHSFVCSFIRSFIRSSSQILLPQYLVNGLSSFGEIYREYSLAPTDELIRFWSSKVKVTPWFKYVVAKASTLMLGVF